VRDGYLRLVRCRERQGAALGPVPGILDIASMYLFLNFWLLYNLKRLYGWSDATFLVAYVVAAVAFTSPRLLSPAYGVPVFVLVATVALATEWIAARPLRRGG